MRGGGPVFRRDLRISAMIAWQPCQPRPYRITDQRQTQCFRNSGCHCKTGAMIGVMIDWRRREDQPCTSRVTQCRKPRLPRRPRHLAVGPAHEMHCCAPRTQPRQRPPHLAAAQFRQARWRPKPRARVRCVTIAQRDNRHRHAAAHQPRYQQPAAQRFIIRVRRQHDDAAARGQPHCQMRRQSQQAERWRGKCVHRA